MCMYVHVFYVFAALQMIVCEIKYNVYYIGLYLELSSLVTRVIRHSPSLSLSAESVRPSVCLFVCLTHRSGRRSIVCVWAGRGGAGLSPVLTDDKAIHIRVRVRLPVRQTRSD